MTRQFVLATIVLLTTAACSSEPEVPVQPYPDGGPPPPPPPTNTVVAPPPDAGAPQPVAGPCNATTQLALQQAIEARGKKELGVGMKPEGAFACQVLPEGGTVPVPITVQQGRCYTVLAQAFPNVMQVDLFLKPNLGPSPLPLFANLNPVLAQSQPEGVVAVIGAGKNCYKNLLPVPIPGVVEARATTGAGPVAVQVYSK